MGLSGDHAPSDAGKSLPGLVMMVGKPMVKLSGKFPGQLHPELALSVQARHQSIASFATMSTSSVSLERSIGDGDGSKVPWQYGSKRLATACSFLDSSAFRTLTSGAQPRTRAHPE